MKIRKRKGFSLVEVIAVVAIIAIISMVFVNLTLVPARARNKVDAEYDMQENLRYASSIVNDKLRVSSSIYVKTKPYNGTFGSGSPGELTDEWDYIIWEKDSTGRTRLMHYRWDWENNKRAEINDEDEKDIIIKSNENTDFEVRFLTQDKPDSVSNEKEKLIEFVIVSKNKTKDGKVVSEELKSKIIPLNADRINPNPDGTNEGNAIAFRTGVINATTTGTNSTPVVSFVIDLSGSMYFDMAGRSYVSTERTGTKTNPRYTKGFRVGDNTGQVIDNFTTEEDKIFRDGLIDNYVVFGKEVNLSENTRIEIARKSFKEFFENLHGHSGAMASVTSFGSVSEKSDVVKKLNSASSPLTDEKTYYDQVKDYFNKVMPYPSSYTSGSGTNIGDGLRMAYTQLDRFMESEAKDYKNVTLSLVLFTDGENSHYTVGKYDGDEMVQRSDARTTSSLDYVRLIGEKIRNFEAEHGKKINTYVIGFSSRSRDKAQSNQIGKILGAQEVSSGKFYYDTSSGEELNIALYDILEKIDPKSIWKTSNPK